MLIGGLLGLAQTASAVEADAWKGSRWQVVIEESTPTPLELSAAENESFRTRLLQLELLLKCSDVHPLGKKRAEVDCKADAVAMRATPRRPEPGAANNRSNQMVLDDLVSRLQGSVIRITVSRDGRVTTVDLPELSNGTRRESESREMLRRLVYDAVSGFSLEQPDELVEGAEWVEKNSALLRAPTEPATLGLSKTEHSVSLVDGAVVVQGQGSGTFTAPYVPWDFSYDGSFQTRGTSGTTTVTNPGFGGRAAPRRRGRTTGS
ncbi:MAG: hypothetical protein R3F59_06605 [Myxococcota bacterium]